jgi:uncharacterized lipoprotein YmbA
MKRMPRSTTFVCTALLLSGCFGTQPVPFEHYYRLTPAVSSPPATGASAASASGTVLIVLEPVDVRGVHVERPLLHRGTANGSPLEQYPFASWAEPPDTMLQDYLLADLRNGFGVMQVRTSGHGASSAIRLSMRLRAFEQIVDGSTARAHFAATYTATDAADNLLFVLEFDREVAAGGPSPLEFVTALSGLVSDADLALIDRLRAVTAKAAAAGSR